MLKKDYEEIKQQNIYDLEINEKIQLLNNEIPLNLADANEEALNNVENFLKNKRRREQYEKESLISNWVDVDEKIFDEENFEYLNENLEEDYEELESACIENDINNEKDYESNSNNKDIKFKDKEEKSTCCKDGQYQFCLYCNFFKMLEN